MSFVENRTMQRLVKIAFLLLFITLACTLYLYSNSPKSIYPNADFVRIEDFSISRDTFPFIITAPRNTLPPCVRVSYQHVFRTPDRSLPVAEWYQENGWSTGVGSSRASGMRPPAAWASSCASCHPETTPATVNAAKGPRDGIASWPWDR